MSRKFRPGMRVVCIQNLDHGGFVSALYKITVPRLGIVYTLRDVYHERGKLWVRLDEIRQDPVAGALEEPSFAAIAFRPLDESRLDQFRKHLAPRKVEERA